MPICIRGASQVMLLVKNWLASAGDIRDTSSVPELGRFPQRRKLQTAPVFLPGESHKQRSLVGYSPWLAKSRTQLKHICIRLHQAILYKRSPLLFLAVLWEGEFRDSFTKESSERLRRPFL